MSPQMLKPRFSSNLPKLADFEEKRFGILEPLWQSPWVKLTHWTPVLPSYKNQSLDLLNWFLYEGNTGT